MKVRLRQGLNPTGKYWWLNPEREYEAEPVNESDGMLRVDWPAGTPHDLPRQWFEEVRNAETNR
jgi:hypothetical protein